MLHFRHYEIKKEGLGWAADCATLREAGCRLRDFFGMGWDMIGWGGTGSNGMGWSGTGWDVTDLATRAQSITVLMEAM